MSGRVLAIGLDEPEIVELRKRLQPPVLAHPMLPQIRILDGRLLAAREHGPGFLEIDRVLFHGIFEYDFDFITALALWGGPCLPSAAGLLDGRLRLPCLAKALRITRFGRMSRSYADQNQTIQRDVPTVAKWGNWHCGENKVRFTGLYQAPVPTILEPFIEGEAVRVVVIGPRSWQVRLTGESWLKSIHHPAAAFMPEDPELVEDAFRLAAGLGLEIAAVDYMVGNDGQKHLLEVNHVPNVTVFPEIREAFLELAADWAGRAPDA